MMHGKKIAHLNFARGFRGGERQTEVLISALASLGVKQSLVARAGEPLAARVRSQTDIEVIEVSRPLVSALPYCRQMGLLHVHEAKAGHIACQARQLFGTPYVLTRRVDKPPRGTWMNRRLYGKAAGVVAVSSLISDVLMEQFPSVQSGIIHDAHSDLFIDEGVVAGIRKRFEGKFLIGHAGAMVDRHKGQMTLITAMRKLAHSHPQVELLLLGEGEDEAMLRKAAADLPTIHFEGFTDCLGAYLAALDLFVFPSNYEGLGSVILDAMHAGTAVIASEVGGIPDIVKHDQNGVLVPPGDADALAEAIVKLVQDSQRRDRLAAAGKAFSEDYSALSMAQKYQAIYDSILDSQ